MMRPSAGDESGIETAGIAPALAGTGRIAEPLRVLPGADAAPDRLQWCRDGVPIPGAEGVEYVPGTDDDRAEIACRVTRGEASTETAPLRITRRPPQVVAPPWDEILDPWGGEEILPLAQSFSGEGLRFGVMGARARIDPETGLLAIPTDLPLAGEPVRVIAQNSGGSAALEFLVTVEAEAPAAGTRRIFVDFETGTDSQPGTAEAAPRRTVPARPDPGTTIYLRRGTTYRQPIVLEGAGRPGAPVVLDGQSWGAPEAPKARLDLSAPVGGWRPGPVLGGAPTWEMPVPAEMQENAEVFRFLMLFQGERKIHWAQDPAPRNPDYRSEAFSEFHAFQSLRENGDTLFLRAPAVFGTLATSPVGYYVRVWIEGNQLSTRRIRAYDPDLGEIAIDRATRGGNPSMKVPRFAIIGHPDAITEPGLMAYDAARQVVTVRLHDDQPPDAADIRHAAGGTGIRITAPHIEVRGIEVRRCMNMGHRSGGIVALMGSGHGDAAGVVIADNDVRDCAVRGAGILYSHGSAQHRLVDVRVERNTAFNLPAPGCRGVFGTRLRGGLVRLNHAGGNQSTSISLYSSIGTRVYGNTAGKSAGVHGNGFSFYEGCRELVVMFNTVFLPEGGGLALTAQSAASCVFACNTLMTRDGSTVAHHPPAARYPEEGGHLWANNIIQTMGDNRAFQINARQPREGRGVAPTTGTVLVNNIAQGIVSDLTTGLARRTHNVVTALRGNQLSVRELMAIGDVYVPDRNKLFIDWRQGDFRPTAEGWRTYLSRGEPIRIRGVVLDWIGRYRADGSDAWDWRNEPL